MSDQHHEPTAPIGPVDHAQRAGETRVLEAPPRVAAFVAAVRARLTDLPVEEQQELTDGLEADLRDLVAEHGEDALGDPTEYARELRVAAGFDAGTAQPRARRSLGQAVGDGLDGMHAGWDRFVGGLPGDAPGFLFALRPAWWVLRAWIATGLFVSWIWSSSDMAIVPTPDGEPFIGAAILVLAIVGSVQIGRRRWWPGRGGSGSRVLLLALNALALLLAPAMIEEGSLSRNEAVAMYVGDEVGYAYGSSLLLNGQPVRNVYPYDAAGRPLVGVQLLDQEGRRLAVSRQHWSDLEGGVDLRMGPWLNGRTRLYNVFPLAEQRFDPVTGRSVGEARLQTPPYASLPPVERDGVRPSVLSTPR